jgi:metallophosphoesterase (TIGR00282 family)
MIRVMSIGDVFGPKSVTILATHLEELKKKYKPDVIIVNTENAGQKNHGPSEEIITQLTNAGVFIFTGGNHSLARKELFDVHQKHRNLLRPCNFPSGTSGYGYGVYQIPGLGVKIACINVQLRAFMKEFLSCPFKSVESILMVLKNDNPIILIDVHGETTAEKACFGHYFDGSVSAIWGTHTHVQTADEQILPKGTGFITDLGMTGPLHSSIGHKLQERIYNFITQMPAKYEIEENGPHVIAGAIFDIDKKTKQCVHVERIRTIVSG